MANHIATQTANNSNTINPLSYTLLWTMCPKYYSNCMQADGWTPRNNNSNPAIENFIQQINPIISKLSKENSHAIFTGDLNINFQEIHTRIKYQAYFDQFVTNGFYPKIVQPCHFTEKTGSVIEHTFCKFSENTPKSYSGILINNMPDHQPHFTCLDILSNQQNPPKYIMKDKQDEASLLSFYDEIEISLRNTDFANKLTTDPNVT